MGDEFIVRLNSPMKPIEPEGPTKKFRFKAASTV